MVTGFLFHNYLSLKSEVVKGVIFKLYPALFFVANQLITKAVLYLLQDCLETKAGAPLARFECVNTFPLSKFSVHP